MSAARYTIAAFLTLLGASASADTKDLEARVAELEARLDAIAIPGSTVIARSEPVNTAFLQVPTYNPVSCVQVPLVTSFDPQSPLDYDNLMYQFRGSDLNHNSNLHYDYYLHAPKHHSWNIKLPSEHDSAGNEIRPATYEKFWRLGTWKSRGDGSRFLAYRDAFRLLPGASQINFVSVGPWDDEKGLRLGIEWSGGGRMTVGRWFTFYERGSAGAPQMILADRLIQTDEHGRKTWIVHHRGKKYGVALTELP